MTSETALRDQLAGLPQDPGVYMFRDSDEAVLYVGKAKSLRKRVLSYFRSPLREGEGELPEDWRPRPRSVIDPKVAELVWRIDRVEVFVTSTETEALILEDNLVKRHRPAFNIKLRDDKSYPYIAISLDEEFPRVYFTRERHRRDRVYFGPFSNASKVRETLNAIGRIFPNRPCEGPEPGRPSGVPCLDYHIKRCMAPCVDYISKDEYRVLIDQTIDFLSGRYRHLEDELEHEMAIAAERKQYERAAVLRDRLSAVKHLMERQSATTGSVGTADVLGVALEGDTANVQVLQVRDGVLQDRQSFFVEAGVESEVDQVLEQFALEYYAMALAIPPLVVLPRDSGDLSALEALLAERRGAGVELRAPARGEKRKLSELAARNARFALDQDRLRHERARQGRRDALTELAGALGLPALPARIECYDISNLGATHSVASMVVFHDGAPEKSHYRSFVLRHEGGPDDFARMEEALGRRGRHLSRPNEESDASFGHRPGLIVIDGGKGQLAAAGRGLSQAGVDDVPMIGLAKRLEEVFLPGRSDPLLLPESSAGLRLLQSVRDEAHRFALRHHRRRRSAGMTESALDGLPGVGPVRRRLLIEHFKTPERILSADREELEAVPGLPPKVARAVYDHLNHTGVPVSSG
ncbi:MAG: excinuclease ABC subunit UvrC [Thermoleophilia bacterium]|nr:excinuclease ABC subunit UvrC [Thermoleophilia bacterium]